MKVTVYTDASLRGKKATWAVWLRSNKGRIVKSGKCPSWIKDINAAEIFAIYKGAQIAIKKWDATFLWVRTDSKTAITMLIKKGTIRTREDIQQARGLFQQLDIDAHFKHIKAHGNGETIQSYINNECDRRAGRRHR
jgi:ribonuclease HI